MDPVLSNYFNKFKQAFDIVTTKGSPEEQKRNEAHAFEKFVNYVLFSLDDPDVFTSDTELLDSVCVGGNNDTGIDGIGIKINDRLVRNIEQVKLIAQDCKKITVEFVFIQSKMSSGVEIAEFNKFGLGVKNFFQTGICLKMIRFENFERLKTMSIQMPQSSQNLILTRAFISIM